MLKYTNFRKWANHYHDVLDDMYNIFIKNNLILDKCSFNDFSKFIFNNSSKYKCNYL